MIDKYQNEGWMELIEVGLQYFTKIINGESQTYKHMEDTQDVRSVRDILQK